jgi:hypothetical protein
MSNESGNLEVRVIATATANSLDRAGLRMALLDDNDVRPVLGEVEAGWHRESDTLVPRDAVLERRWEVRNSPNSRIPEQSERSIRRVILKDLLDIWVLARPKKKSANDTTGYRAASMLRCSANCSTPAQQAADPEPGDWHKRIMLLHRWRGSLSTSQGPFETAWGDTVTSCLPWTSQNKLARGSHP